jgi:hypothetical protein
LNCGTALVGEYCHNCGQSAQQIIIPASELIREATAEVLSIERNFARSWRDLLTGPGRVTSEYIAGRRKFYITPFKLYLVSSVLYFLILTVTDSSYFFFFKAGDDEQSHRMIRLLPRLMFFILPLYALLLKLLYRKRYYFEHLVFALHYHAFAFAALALHTILQWAFTGAYSQEPWAWWVYVVALADTAVQLSVFIYLFLALRHVYRSSGLGSVLKVIILMGGYLGILIALGALVLRLNTLIGGL